MILHFASTVPELFRHYLEAGVGIDRLSLSPPDFIGSLQISTDIEEVPGEDVIRQILAH